MQGVACENKYARATRTDFHKVFDCKLSSIRFSHRVLRFPQAVWMNAYCVSVKSRNGFDYFFTLDGFKGCSETPCKIITCPDLHQRPNTGCMPFFWLSLAVE